MVSWTRHSAAPCICRHGPASLSSPRARGIAYMFVAVETNRTPYGTRAEESTHAGLAGDRMSDLGGASRCWIVLMRSWDDCGAMECVSSSGGLLELRSEHPHTTDQHGSKGGRWGGEWWARCFEGELQQALLMACGGVWRPYSSLQYRPSALAVVGHYTLALSVSISRPTPPCSRRSGNRSPTGPLTNQSGAGFKQNGCLDPTNRKIFWAGCAFTDTIQFVKGVV